MKQMEPTEIHRELIRGIVAMVEGTVKFGMEPGDAVNCLLSACVVIAGNFADPVDELKSMSNILIAKETISIAKIYCKERKQNGKQ